MKDGFVKVAAASPKLKVADVYYNTDRIIECMEKAFTERVKVLVFPELSITGCTCRDLFKHRVLLDSALEQLNRIAEASYGNDMLVFVGLPVSVGSKVYSCAAAVSDGCILGFTPRKRVRNSLFSPASESVEVFLDDEEEPVYLSSELIYKSSAVKGLEVAVELGNDIFAPDAPHIAQSLSGATVIAQMASFPETTTSAAKARLLTKASSLTSKSAFILAAPGNGESTTDNCYSGLRIISENGEILVSAEDETDLIISEIDIDYLLNIRREETDAQDDVGFEPYYIGWGSFIEETTLTRKYSKLPQIPDNQADFDCMCERLLDIQVNSLVKRMEYAHLDHCIVGISGGSDSTLAVMISAMAVKKMGLPPANVIACTMPCFGTSTRTKSNAVVVAEQIGATVRIIDISDSVNRHLDDIGHSRTDYSVTFENAQARKRTQILMDLANKFNGLNVGTEDLSEYIDGWCTYNGDHTSMYDVNMGLTKTHVRANLRYIASKTEDAILARALWDVLDCPVTPELLPIHDDKIEQKSEDSVGSYSLQDFFTHKMLVCGFGPAKTFRLAKYVYGDEFSDPELIKWLKSYCKRLFSQQFKRSCLMDGPAVEDFSVSPRNGYLIPSDAENTVFLRELSELEETLNLKS